MAPIDLNPHFIASAVLFLPACCTLFILPRQRRALLLSGLLSAPLALLSWQHVPCYWQPRETFGCITTMEDLLFTTSIGIMSWFMAVLPFRGRVTIRPEPREVVRRGVFCFIGGVAIIEFVMILMGTPTAVMPATLMAMAAAALILLSVRRDLLPLSCAGGAGTMIYHFLGLSVVTAVWPATRTYWNPATLLPYEVLGLPAYELIWAFGFGFLWPLVFGYICEARWK